MSQKTADSWDPWGARPEGDDEAERRLREAENVLASYHRTTDVLAEALQNAIDAIDANTRADPEAPRRLQIDFNERLRQISVTDSGTGMSERELAIVFQPNVTFKAGARSRSTATRSRGEKGVGLSFLMLACDHLQIETCDGDRLLSVSVEGAATWAVSDGEVEPPTGSIQRSSAETWGNAATWTRIVLRDIKFADPDRQLFGFSMSDLVWTLRTMTAVGNTSFLFESAGYAADPEIDVELNFTAPKSLEAETVRVPYRYATPEDILSRAEDEVRVWDYDDLAPLDTSEKRKLTKNAAVRRVYRATSKTGIPVYVYLFAMDGNAMSAVLRSLRTQGQSDRELLEWQGFFVATRKMPTGIAIPGGIFSPRGYERRVFMLMQVDHVKLDVGRKTLPGGTVAMLRSIAKEAWDEMNPTIRLIAPTARSAKLARLVLRRHIRAALELDLLECDLPYQRVPDKPIGVAALFHEMLGAGWPGIEHIRPLSAGVFNETDALMYLGDPDQTDPVHAVFGESLEDLVSTLEDDDLVAGTAGIGVVWSAGELPSHVVAAVDGRSFERRLLIDGGASGGLPVLVLEELLAGDQ